MRERPMFYYFKSHKLRFTPAHAGKTKKKFRRPHVKLHTSKTHHSREERSELEKLYNKDITESKLRTSTRAKDTQSKGITTL